MKIKNSNLKGLETIGALLIRNSWGTEWGEKGYGWLPFVTDKLDPPKSVDNLCCLTNTSWQAWPMNGGR